MSKELWKIWDVAKSRGKAQGFLQEAYGTVPFGDSPGEHLKLLDDIVV